MNDARSSLWGALHPRPWTLTPEIAGSPAFIRSADGKTMITGLRSNDVGDAVIRALAVVDALRQHLPVIEDAYYSGAPDALVDADGAIQALRLALGEARDDV